MRPAASAAGSQPPIGILRDAGKIAAETIEPLEDIQASAGYRRDLVRAMVRRALDQALKR